MIQIPIPSVIARIPIDVYRSTLKLFHSHPTQLEVGPQDPFPPNRNDTLKLLLIIPFDYILHLAPQATMSLRRHSR